MRSWRYCARTVAVRASLRWRKSVRDLDVPDRSEAALNNLIGACHIRVLGDVLIESMSWRDWLKRLDKLDRACKRELKRQGKEGWESKRRREQGQELERRK